MLERQQRSGVAAATHWSGAAAMRWSGAVEGVDPRCGVLLQKSEFVVVIVAFRCFPSFVIASAVL